MGSSVILPTPGQPTQGPDPNFKRSSLPSAVSFLFNGIGPPSAVYVQQDDQVDIQAVSNIANEIVTFRFRVLHVALPVPGQPDAAPPQTAPVGTPISPYIGMYEFTVNLGAARAFAGIQRSLGEGFLLSAVAVSSLSTTRGQTFARAVIFRGSAASISHAQVLLSDYTTVKSGITWPGGIIRQYLEGPGFIHSVQVANPAAGTDWTLTVPANTHYRVMSMEAQLAVANSGAARPVEIIVDDGANIVARMSTNTTAPINATANINFSNAGTPSVSIASDLYAQMPSALFVAGGHRIRSVTTNIVAGDAWTNIWFLMEEWLDF